MLSVSVAHLQPAAVSRNSARAGGDPTLQTFHKGLKGLEQDENQDQFYSGDIRPPILGIKSQYGRNGVKKHNPVDNQPAGTMQKASVE
jgi:hypothetical protein